MKVGKLKKIITEQMLALGKENCYLEPHTKMVDEEANL